MKNQILIEIKNSLDKMEETRKVDLAILDNLATLRNALKTIKSKWLEVKDSDGFYFYQAARNVELILGKMEHRFKNSQKTNENPKIIKDSLLLLPNIDDILETTQKSTINPQTINDVLKKTYSLRNKAASTNLIESLEISRETLDKDNLRLQFSALMQKLDA